MIKNQWYVVLSSRQVKDKPVGVKRMGENLVFWRDINGKVACCLDLCVHRGVKLSPGKVEKNGRLACPFHGLEYDSSGKVQCIPSNGRTAKVPDHFKIKNYRTHEAHDFIWIWWGESPPEDLAPPRFFEDVDETELRYAEFIDPWKVHYSRVLENQIDTIHVPFVHWDTIGRGKKYVCDGPYFEWVRDDMFRVQPNFHKEDGTLAKKPADITTPYPKPYKLELLMPNLWQNYVGKKMRIIAAFVPVDEENTLLYARNYQGFVMSPVIGKLASLSLIPLNYHIIHQDRAIVNTHRHKASSLRGGEKLVQGDKPLIEYRKKRAALIDQAAQK